MRISGGVNHQILRFAGGNFGQEERRFRRIHDGFGNRRAPRSHRSVGGEGGVQVEQVRLDLLRDGHDGRLHVELQKVGHGQNLGYIRNLEGGFGARVEHDLRVPDVRILQLHRVALNQVVGNQSGRDRYVHRVSGLRQDRFVIAIDEVPHHEVPHQGGQGIGRH